MEGGKKPSAHLPLLAETNRCLIAPVALLSIFGTLRIAIARRSNTAGNEMSSNDCNPLRKCPRGRLNGIGFSGWSLHQATRSLQKHHL